MAMTREERLLADRVRYQILKNDAVAWAVHRAKTAAGKRLCRVLDPVVRERDRLYARTYAKRYYHAHKERMRLLARVRQHNSVVPVLRRARMREWLQSPAGLRYRAVRKAAGSLTEALIKQVYASNVQKYGQLTCYLCYLPITDGTDNLEHKTPVCRGGRHELANLAVAHSTCNYLKGARTEDEYRRLVLVPDAEVLS